MADRLTLARALEQGGIGRDAAEHIATEIIDGIHENVTTKTDLRATESALTADLQATRTALEADLAALQTDLRATDTALRTEVGAVRVELAADIASVRADLKADVALVRADLSLVEHRLLTRLGGVIVAATGILVAIHYIH